MNRIELIRNQGFPWFSRAGCHVRGYGFDPADRLLEGDALAKYFQDSGDFNGFTERVAACNGLFSVVMERSGDCWLACDPVRAFPLFYYQGAGEIFIADSTDHLLEMQAIPAVSPETGPRARSSSARSLPITDEQEDRHANLPLVDLNVSEFLSAGFVSGRETLLRDVFQVQAGESLCIDGDKAAGQFYHTYQAAQFKEAPESMLLNQLEEVSQSVFKRLIRSLDGRTAVIALSGGYDSRFIAAMFRQLKYERIICYTYGREGNADMEGAAIVAERLGFPLIRIPYNVEMIRDFHTDPSFGDYVRFSANHASMFFLQEFFALKYLREGKHVPDDAVFIPGHSGDFLGGGLYIRHGLKPGHEPVNALVKRICRIKHIYDHPDRQTREVLREKIRQTLAEKAKVPDARSFTIHEDWDLKEKLAKFIVNSCSVYAWFGYTYRLPFYDLAFLDFFRDLPYGLKSGKYLYDKYLKGGPFDRYGINLEHETQPPLRTHYLVRWKSRLKQWIPSALLPSRPPGNDPIFYHEITRQLREDMAGKGIPLQIRNRSYNSLLIQWYITSLRHGWI